MAFGQNDTLDISESITESGFSLELPPLDQVIDTALMHSPLLKYYQDLVKQSEYEFLASRYDWLQSSYIHADYTYGQYGSNQELSLLSLGYATGAALSIPISAIFGTKSRRKVQALNIESAIHQKQEAENTLRSLVIRQYNSVLLKQELVRIKNGSSQSTLVHMKMAEREFHEGVIPVSELAKVSAFYIREIGEFEVAKSEFSTEYMILEELVGVDFRFTKW